MTKYFAFLKIGSYGIRSSFLECRTKQVNTFARIYVFHTSFATNKASHILNRHISCSCNDTINSKSIIKNCQKSHFLSYTISLIINIFGSCEQWSRRIYMQEKLIPNR